MIHTFILRIICYTCITGQLIPALLFILMIERFSRGFSEGSDRVQRATYRNPNATPSELRREREEKQDGYITEIKVTLSLE